MIRAGRLDRRITLRRPDETRDAHGGVTSAYVDVAIVFAELRDQRGREYLVADKDAGERRAVFLIRYRTDVRPTWRVLFGVETFEIEHVAEVGRRVGCELQCRRIA